MSRSGWSQARSSADPDPVIALSIANLERDLNSAGTTFEKHVYPEVDHPFLNEQRKDVYREANARDAWSKIIPFLRQHLR